MSNIRLWSTTAASNNFATSSGGWPENMLASAVNNAARQNLADVRGSFEEYPFFDFGYTPTYVSASSFTVSGDRTSTFQVGRRVKCTHSTPSTRYGQITASSYSGGTLLTTVTVLVDASLTLTAALTLVAVEVAPMLDSLPVVTTAGTSTAYTVVLPGATAYHKKMAFFINVHTTSGVTPTLQVTGLTAIALCKGTATAINSGDLIAGATYGVVYDGTYWQVVGIGSAGATVGGSTTQVQYNNAGALAGSANFTYDGSGTIFLGTGINLGNASDTTITRASAGDINIEGNIAYRAGGTDIPAADGGTGRSSHTAYAVICGGTTTTAAQQSVASVGSSGDILTSNGAGALPTFQTPTSGTAATQSDQETATSTSTFVSPGRQQYHPSASKAWVAFNGIGTIAIRRAYNVGSLTDNGVGDYTINFTTSFSAADYAFAGTTQATANNTVLIGKAGTAPTTSSCRVTSLRPDTQAATDCDYICFVAYGDL